MISELKQLRNWLIAIENKNQELEAENIKLKQRNELLQKNIDNCFYELDRFMLINQDLKNENKALKLELKKGN